MTELESLTAWEWDGLTGVTVLLPTGSTEQHGGHLPVGTDTRIATAVCKRAAAVSSRLVVAPAIPYGVSDHHRALPGGAVTAGADAFAAYVAAVALSLVDQARHRGILIVNGHGGNRPALAFALDRIGSTDGEQPLASCSWWDLVADVIEGADGHAGSSRVGHAGAVETSVMLALGASVRSEDLRDPDPSLDLGSAVRWLDFAKRFPSGVIGDARAADAQLGEQILGTAADRLADLASRLSDDWWEAPA
jgi:creatinine amidohydrolase